jgi:hypothetical protein
MVVALKLLKCNLHTNGVGTLVDLQWSNNVYCKHILGYAYGFI